MSSNIRSLSLAREKRIFSRENISYEEATSRITLIGPTVVSCQSVALLHTIAYWVYQDLPHLSYSFLSKAAGMTKPTLIKYITELEEANLLKVIRTRRDTKSNNPNYFAIDFTGPLGADMDQEKRKWTKKLGSKNILPPYNSLSGRNAEKHKENNNIEDDCGDDKEFKVVKNFYSKEKIKDKRKKIKDKTGAPPSASSPVSGKHFDTLDQAISHVGKKAEDRKLKVSTKAATPRVTMATIRACWEQAMLKHYPTVPPISLSPKSTAIFKNKMKPILATSTMEEFFEFVVSDWENMRNTRFDWLYRKNGTVSEAPSVPELMRFFRIFAQAFADRKAGEEKDRRVFAEIKESNESTAELDRLKKELAAEKAEARRLRAANEKIAKRARIVDRAYRLKDSNRQEPKPLSKDAYTQPIQDFDDLPEWGEEG